MTATSLGKVNEASNSRYAAGGSVDHRQVAAAVIDNIDLVGGLINSHGQGAAPQHSRSTIVAAVLVENRQGIAAIAGHIYHAGGRIDRHRLGSRPTGITRDTVSVVPSITVRVLLSALVT